MGSKIGFSAVKIVGTSTEETWAQSFVFEPENTEQAQKIGTLFGVLSIKTNQETEAAVIGKQKLVSLQEKYLSQKGEKRLEDLRKILEDAQEENDFQIELTTGLLWQNILYFAGLGNGKIILKRKEKIITLWEMTEEDPLKIKTASGYSQENDIAILETSGFFKIINLDKLKETLDNRSINETADILAPQILNSEENATAAAVLLSFGYETTAPEEFEEEEIEKSSKETSPQKEPFLINLQKGVKNLLRKITAKISKPPSVVLPRIEKNEEKPRRTLITISIILLFLLSITIFLNVNKQKEEKQKTQVEKTLEITKSKYEEGKALVDLNPIRAKTLLEDAKKTAEETLKTLKKGTKEEQKLTAFLNQLQESLNITAKIYKINPQIFFDLTIIKEKGSAAKLSTFQKELLFFDLKNNSFYLFNTEKKSGEIIAGGEKTKGTTQISLYGKSAYFLNPQKGIQKTDTEAKSAPEEIIKNNSEWGEIVDMTSFGGNLYLLDKKKNQIWKYIATETGLSDIKNYLTLDTSPDFKNAVSMAIDGSVWVLRSDGELLKFTQGRIDNFTIQGLDGGFNNPTKVFTSDDLKNLYILDKGNKRVVVLGKDSNYQAQYQADLIGNCQDISVNEETKKIFLLESSKIYTIDLK